MKKHYLSFILVITVFVFAMPFKSFGQENKNIDKVLNASLQDLLNVGMVSASKKKQSIQDAPATAYVITQDIIFQRGYFNLMDLIEDIPEVEIQYNSNPQFRNLVTFRGVAGNEKILIMMNGIRVTPATGDYYPIATNFSLADAYRVEVIIGPASALYGVDAFGGIINIITHNQETQTMQGVSITTSGGNFTTTNNSLSLGLKADKLLLSGTWNNYYSAEPYYPEYYDVSYDWYLNSAKPDGFVVESPYYGQIYHNSFMKKRAGDSFFGDSISREFKMPTFSNYVNINASYEKISAGFIHHEETHSTAYGLDPKYTAYESDQYFKQSHNIFYVKHIYSSFNKKWSLQSTMTHNSYTIDPYSEFMGATTRWQSGFIYGKGQSTKIEEQISYELNSKNSLVGGFSYEELNSVPQTGLTPSPIDPSIPLVNQDIYFIGGAGYDPYATDDMVGKYDSNRIYKQKVYQLNYDNIGGYLQWQRLGRKLDVTVGMRYDKNSRFGETYNPRIGLVYSANRKLKIKLLAGSSYLAPSPQKAYAQSGSFYSFDLDTATGKKTFYSDLFRVANDSLKPELLYSFEGNVSYFLTNNLSLSVNAYYTIIQNLINFYGFANTSTINSYPDIVSQKYETSTNEGEAIIYGFVPKVNYLIKAGSRLQINTWVSYHYLKGDYTIKRDTVVEKSDMPFASKSTYKAGVDVNYGRFFLSLHGLRRTPSYSNQTTLYLTPGLDKTFIPENKIIQNINFLLVNANIGYRIKTKGKTKISTFVRGRNILNNLHYNVTYGSDDSMGIYPQDPTRVMFGFNISL